VLFVNRYRLIERIGRGGMGDVWTATDEQLEGRRVVAIKFIHPRLARVRAYRRRFAREMAALAIVEDPNVVRLYDSGIEPQPFMVMERVRGATLRELLQTGGRIEPRTAVSFAIRIALGLNAAHQANLCHRDIKPENIMISNDGRAHVWILDFGIAMHTTGRPEGEGTDRLGTLGYVTPELALGEPVDHRGDLYQLGVVLYEMLTGRMPYGDVDETRETDMHAAHAYAEPDPIPAIVPECPPRLWRIVLRLLAKKPGDRFQSAKALITALRSILFGRQSDTPGPSSTLAARKDLERDDAPAAPIPITRARLGAPGPIVITRAPARGPHERHGGPDPGRPTLPMGTRLGLVKAQASEETGARRTRLGPANAQASEEAEARHTLSVPPAFVPAVRAPFPLAPPAAPTPPGRDTISVLPGHVPAVRAPLPPASPPAAPASVQAPAQRRDPEPHRVATPPPAPASRAAPTREPVSSAADRTRNVNGTIAVFVLGVCAVVTLVAWLAAPRAERPEVSVAEATPALSVTEPQAPEPPATSRPAATSAPAVPSVSARPPRATVAPRVPRRPTEAVEEIRNPWGGAR
jgi:serine/threonine protein kinase